MSTYAKDVDYPCRRCNCAGSECREGRLPEENRRICGTAGAARSAPCRHKCTCSSKKREATWMVVSLKARTWPINAANRKE